MEPQTSQTRTTRKFALRYPPIAVQNLQKVEAKQQCCGPSGHGKDDPELQVPEVAGGETEVGRIHSRVQGPKKLHTHDRELS